MRGMLEFRLAYEAGGREALGNLMNGESFRNRDDDRDEIAVDQMAHHLGDALPALEFIIAGLDAARLAGQLAIDEQRSRTSHDAGLFEASCDRTERLTLLDRDLARGREPRRGRDPQIKPCRDEGDNECADNQYRDVS